MSPSTEEPRFLRLTDVSAILNISTSQTYALVRSGELKAIQIGGRNQWRVERRMLEEYIAEAYGMGLDCIAVVCGFLTTLFGSCQQQSQDVLGPGRAVPPALGSAVLVPA